MSDINHVGVIFADIQNSSALSVDQERLFRTEILPALGVRIREYDLIDLNTWGDGIFATSTNLITIAHLALDIRDFFLHPPQWKELVLRLGIRIALDFVEVDIGPHPITGKAKSCNGRLLTRAARLEPVTPRNTIFVTEMLASHLLGSNYADSFSSNAPKGGDRHSGSNEKRDMHLEKFPETLTFPKNYPPFDVYSLHWGNEHPDVRWHNRLKQVDAIAPIAVESWLYLEEKPRHRSALDRIRGCLPGEEVCFISITAKSVLYPRDPDGGQPLADVSPIARAMGHEIKFRGIVMNPDSDEALLRSRVESPDAKTVPERLLQAHAAAIRDMVKSNVWHPLKSRIVKQLILKRTNYGLSFSLWLFKDQAIIEPYHLGKMGVEKPHLCEFSQFRIFKARTEEYQMLAQHFENLWANSAYVWPDIHGPRGPKSLRFGNQTGCRKS